MWLTGTGVRRSLSLALAGVALVPGASMAKQAALSTGFAAQSAAVLGNEMWVIGVDHCKSSSGCAVVMHSANGGRTFAGVGRGPARWIYDVRRLQTPDVFFADPRNGYAFVFRDGVWATHDAGQSWKRLPLHSPLSFAVGAGAAYAVTANCSRVPCTDFRLQRSDSQTDRWTSAPLPVRSDNPIVQLAARGARVWIVARGAGRNTLARSSDGGRSFTTGAAPCQAGFGADFESSPDGSLWVVCSHGTHGSALRSTDGGAHFEPVALTRLGNGARFGPASAQVAVVSPTGAWATLRRTTDGGRTWRQGWKAATYTTWLKWIAFGDARHGALLLQTTTDSQLGIDRFGMWRTADAGAHWSSVHFS
ncbi:MAG TPA: hypothetical protein VNH45_10085 [Gaiellaceae bacterium]|jgi:photosystem II stability/assembly factor-like uncharacterized protein|nr:hypothetical protein [Gaiellaceae bacterium]